MDSSDIAFQMAGILAFNKAAENAQPVILEPIVEVDVLTPEAYMGDVMGDLNHRRGKILGFDSRQGWQGWDTVEAEIPQSELHDLIVELRSLTQGVGTYEQKFHHLAELTGKLAENVVAEQKKSAA